MSGRGLILAIGAVIAALAVACGTSSQPAAEQVRSDDTSSSNNDQAVSTPPSEGSSNSSVSATPPSLPVPEPTQPLRTLTPDPANVSEEQVGLDPDVAPPDLLASKTGIAVDGPLEGRRLKPVLFFNSFWFAWSDFYPNTELFEP